MDPNSYTRPEGFADQGPQESARQRAAERTLLEVYARYWVGNIDEMFS